jgi:beta-lactam-binding protein with PASTA domain
VGLPGQVLWTEPNIGRSVPPDTPVTIVVGVEAERLGSATPASQRDRTRF